MEPNHITFPPFSLTRLLRTVFGPRPDQRVALLIDLDEPKHVGNLQFLNHPGLTVQRLAHDVFYRGLLDGGLEELNWTGGDIYAYQTTGGSNLDLPPTVTGSDGVSYRFETDLYPRYDILLCISTFSATAPLTAAARRFGFRGATLHGLNQIILSSGLAVDYQIVSRNAEKLRLALTEADRFELEFTVAQETHLLKLFCNRQPAQKSHGLCLGPEPDVANLPAGEVYFVPTGAEGAFPLQYADGTIGKMNVTDGSIVRADLLQGSATTVEAHNRKLQSDPMVGVLGELGFGTQRLPFSGSDIQDEKILGTMHVATGRSDHLGGSLTPDLFAEAQNASHDDILFSPSKTPNIKVGQVRMVRNGQTIPVIERFEPTDYLLGALAN